MPEPDLQRSSAVLVGTSVYAASVTGLHNLPSVDNNLTDLTSALTDPAVLGLPPSQCVTIRNAPDARSVFRTLRQYAMSTDDTLIVYFAGHGLLSHNNDLYLSLSGTDPDELQVSALRYQLLREILVDSRATNRILILDCCFSGIAAEGMSTAPNLNIAGTHILAATPPTEMALAPIGERNTAFTGVFLELLRRGVPGGPTKLTLSELFRHLWSALDERGLPKPQQRTTGQIADLAVFHNPAANDPQDVGITLIEPLPPTARPTSRRPSRRTTVALSTAATIVALASGLTYAIAAQSDTPSQSSPPLTSSVSESSTVSVAPAASLPKTASPSPPVTSASNKQAPDATLVVRSTWPTMRGCDGGTAVAMSSEGPALTTFPAGGADLREQVVARGGAFWLSGFIYMFMSAEAGKTVDILEITPSLKPASHTPAAWVYLPQGGCGGRGSRVFDLDLDTKKLVDKGIDAGADGTLDPSVNPDAKLTRTEPLGQTFSVSQDSQALVRIDAHGCKANYTFNLNVTYSIAGDTAVHVQSFGPFRSDASSGDTPVYATESPDGQNWQFVKTGDAQTYYKCK